MSIILICPAGHRWTISEGAETLAGEVGTRCPVCGVTVQPDFTTPRAAEFDLAPPSDAPMIPGYEMLAQLDPGGMGVVYKARQLQLNRLVALKMIRTRELATAREIERFRLEALAVARLDHPHIVRIHDFGEHQGLSYFSMEYVEGGSLAQRLRTGPPFASLEAAALVEALARAMHHAHRAGILHRDLKPANVLLTSEGIPKIADFGLAKLVLDDSGQTQSGVALGTPSYMPPEQAEGRLRDISETSDVYSLGAILYEVLTGQPPFRAPTRDMTLLRVLHDDPTPPHHLRAEVPPSLEAICLKCLEKNPPQRYPSALSLAEDLQRFQQGEPLLIEPVSEWDRQARWARRGGYELLDLVGWTALGLVYKARQLSLNRLVLLKTIAPRAQNEETRDRFRTEAQTVANMDHPNIIKIFDFGEIQDQPYFSQEYVEGGTLADFLQGEPWPYKQTLQLVETLARAAHYAHEQGIVHGDLRPFHILLTASGVPKIQGFALGRLVTREMKWRLKRSPSNYIAPEQVSGKLEDLGPATDVYALGAILYELLTGRPPVLGQTVAETIDQILRHVPESVLDLQPALPSRLDVICRRCLAKNPRERYATARELAEELRRVAAGEQTQTDDFDLIPGYELLEELGRGGIGVVYRARQLSLHRLVALKLYRERVDLVQATTRALGRLSHPHLVRVYDSGERDGVLYVVEELIEGDTLEQRINGQPQSVAESCRLIATLARALHYVHHHGIVHRNLKPSAILFDEAGQPRISSFDLALLTEGTHTREEQEAGLHGTLNYMAPEQALGQLERIGPSTDIYALGLILHELLCGERVVTAPLVQEAWKEVVYGQPPPPSQKALGVPREVDEICRRCLEKEPERRYSSALHLAEELEKTIAGHR